MIHWQVCEDSLLALSSDLNLSSVKLEVDKTLQAIKLSGPVEVRSLRHIRALVEYESDFENCKISLTTQTIAINGKLFCIDSGKPVETNKSFFYNSWELSSNFSIGFAQSLPYFMDNHMSRALPIGELESIH